ncbi:MAG: bifunctional phosphopantothenoylcysteine decarboxylase/phosphopantothenate--cysteine ligase CoaBC [Pseudomonadota bacterium]
MSPPRHILLIIGGGIAAFKCLDLIRRARERGHRVTCVMTRAAVEFVTPLSVSSLSGAKVYQDLFDLTDEAEMGHIQLSRAADLVIVAPATADMMAKMAGGHADDLASTLLMATDKPVLIAPAMNVRMWTHAATQRNLATLTGDGIHAVGPNDGDMACGEFGPGRMAEPLEILDAVERVLGGAGRLVGRHILVTSGPTHEPIDPVRYIANRSSGKQGMAIAAALIAEGAQVSLITGPTVEPVPPGVAVKRVETARQMLAAVEAALPADAAIFAAAVADWRTADESPRKMKKDGSGDLPDLCLAENPDILATIAQRPVGARPPLVIGFAAETNDVVANATAKRKRKGCNWIVANDVSGDVMGGSRNTVTLIDEQGAEDWPEADKTEVARRLAARVADWLAAETASC